jgi:hypothetical protein
MTHLSTIELDAGIAAAGVEAPQLDIASGSHSGDVYRTDECAGEPSGTLIEINFAVEGASYVVVETFAAI